MFFALLLSVAATRGRDVSGQPGTLILTPPSGNGFDRQARSGSIDPGREVVNVDADSRGNEGNSRGNEGDRRNRPVVRAVVWVARQVLAYLIAALLDGLC